MLKITVWGTGIRANNFIKMIVSRYSYVAEIVAVTSNEKIDEGKMAIGNDLYPFVRPNRLCEIEFDLCFICSSAYEEIIEQIKDNEFIDIQKVYNEIDAWPLLLKHKFLYYYRDDQELKQNGIYQYVEEHGLTMYPYSWFDKLQDEIKEVYEEDGYKYIFYKGKKCFYPKEYSTDDVLNSANFFIKEQQLMSPHCYIPNDEWKICGGIVVDCGSAEANFTLDVIDDVDKIYVVEGDSMWWEPLEKTFKDYNGKVKIIKKYLDSYRHEGYDTIDGFVVEDKINFIKMDIEGYELKALYGAREHIKKSDDLKLSVCTYHNHEDHETIKIYLESLGCECTYSNGYLFRMDESIWTGLFPEIRKGMLYGKKVSKNDI